MSGDLKWSVSNQQEPGKGSLLQRVHVAVEESLCLKDAGLVFPRLRTVTSPGGPSPGPSIDLGSGSMKQLSCGYEDKDVGRYEQPSLDLLHSAGENVLSLGSWCVL